MNKINLLLAMLLLAALLPRPSQAQEAPPLPDVAWIQAGQVWLAWSEAEVDPIALPAEGVSFALFSPQGTRLAYLENGTRLFILELADPVGSAQAISSDLWPAESLLGYLAWQGEDRLWFNSLQNPSNPNNAGDNLLQTDWALWVWNAADGGVTPGSNQGRGGVAYPSPDGAWVAWVYPGVYGEIPTTITFYSALGDQTGEYQFPAVSSASHLAWLPEIAWAGDYIRLAVPDPDLVYTFQRPYPPTRLLEVQTDGTARELGQLEMAFPLTLAWSGDGAQLAYMTPNMLGDGADLFIFQAEAGLQTQPLSRLALGSDVIFLRQHLFINELGQQVYIWREDTYQMLYSVWGIAQSRSGDYVILEGSPTGVLNLYENDMDSSDPILRPVPMPILVRPLATDLTTFEVQVVGGLAGR
jgi:hypothetical protein